MPADFPGGEGFQGFIETLTNRLFTLAQEVEDRTGKREDFDFVMPIGLLLVVDQANGGDVTADELVRRFHLLHAESDKAIDFYFLGWQWRDNADRSKGIMFDLESFRKCRSALKKIGVKTFGGSADLILVDVRYRYRAATQDPEGRSTPYGYSEQDFNFPEAVQINLATSREKKQIPPVGDFLQSIIAVAEDLRNEGNSSNPVFSISDRLGIATARHSFLDYILKKWGAIIGADKLEILAIRKLAPVARMYGSIHKDNVFAPGDVPALSLPRGVSPSTGVPY
ncbi:MAG TPA: hypothetical protein VGG03_26040 [Thermoanaerobaculia bacterium]|jgi:hypothetical protein